MSPEMRKRRGPTALSRLIELAAKLTAKSSATGMYCKHQSIFIKRLSALGGRIAFLCLSSSLQSQALYASRTTQEHVGPSGDPKRAHLEDPEVCACAEN